MTKIHVDKIQTLKSIPKTNDGIVEGLRNDKRTFPPHDYHAKDNLSITQALIICIGRESRLLQKTNLVKPI